MKINHVLLIALLASAAASAREPKQPRKPLPVPPIIALFDADHDGVISTDEIETASDALAQLDRNSDGEITVDEVGPPPRDRKPEDGEPKGPPPGKFPPPPVIAALDTDKDGTISAEELEAAPESLKELDINEDGELSPQELHPKGPPPHDGGQGGKPRRPAPEGEDVEME